MSDPTREVLAELLARSRRGITARVNDTDRHQAGAILAEFLVVPRSDIVGTEYGWRRAPDCIAHLTETRAEAIESAMNLRPAGPAWSRAEAVERSAVLPWSPIPLPEDGQPCETCGGTGNVACWSPGGPCPALPPCEACGPCASCTAPKDGEPR